MEGKAVLLSKVGIGALAGLMLMGGLCRRTIGTTITVVNGANEQIRNVEVTYRGGTVGAAMIGPRTTFQQWVPAKGDCSVKITFANAANKQMEPTSVDTKKPCPSVTTFTVGADLKVTTNLQ
jgi:hypothetical protein